jgi:hypothetical protein
MTRQATRHTISAFILSFAIALLVAPDGPAPVLADSEAPDQAPQARACRSGYVWNQRIRKCVRPRSKPSSAPRACRRGYVWNPRKRKCFRFRSDLLNDQDRYDYAVWLGRGGKYRESNELLKTMKDQTAPRVLTYLGYNHRHLGDWKKGMALYKQALAKNQAGPGRPGARRVETDQIDLRYRLRSL